MASHDAFTAPNGEPAMPEYSAAFSSRVAAAESRAPALMLYFLSHAQHKQRIQAARSQSITSWKLSTLEAGIALRGSTITRRELRKVRLVVRLARATHRQNADELVRAMRAVWRASTSSEKRRRRPAIVAILKYAQELRKQQMQSR